MINTKKILIFIFIACQSIYSFTKENIQITEINDFFTQITNAKSDKEKEEINEQLITYLINFLQKAQSFDVNYDSVTKLSVLKSDDKKLNVYTWNLYYSDASFKYFGFLQYKTKDKILVYTLSDKKYNYDDDLEAGISRKFNSNMEWYGAIYYELITKKYNSKTYYTLIGWDGADLFINRKVVEVLEFNRYNLPIFGNKKFKTSDGILDRLVFEFAERAVMILRYNAKQDMIIMDHLSPSEERFRGNPVYYGPDYTYNGLVFENGKWILKPEIDYKIAIPYKENKDVNKMKKERENANK